MDQILLAHGGGGQLSQELLETIVFPRFGQTGMDDSALLARPEGNLAFTSDSFVVSPIFFPGGNIGRLAVCGTINDLATRGAIPLAMSLALIIEEGFAISELEQIIDAVATTAQESQVNIVTGDTKVVPRGKLDSIVITTAGIGVVQSDSPPSLSKVRPGDALIVTGTIADHGMAIMMARTGVNITHSLMSDVAPLADLARQILQACPSVRVLKDPTRGGVAVACHEMARASNVRIQLHETKLPIRPEVRQACDLFGIDPLEVANEGKLLVVCAEEDVQLLLAAIKQHPLATNARQIGSVLPRGQPPAVTLRTIIGSERVVGIPVGELLPRIC